MGTALKPLLPNAIFLSSSLLDVTDERNVRDVFTETKPIAVLHLAAVTDHQCPDTEKMIRTNIIGTQFVAKYAEALCAKLIYTSTHYVYPGVRGLYKETDSLKPVGLYAWTKLAGEHAVRAVSTDHLIIRGSWYTREKLELWKDNALADAFSNRERVQDAAQKIASLIENRITGTVNIGGKRRTFLKLLKDEGYKPKPIKRDDLSLPYPFPTDSSVCTDKYDSLVI